MNLPNKLTVLRLVLSLVFVLLMSIQHPIPYFFGYIVFTIAAISDYYDGKIARQYGLITNFGKLLDPVADKVLMVSGFLVLMTIPDLRVPAWTIIVILAREYLVTGARSLAAAEGAIIAANSQGKMKTILQFVYVFTFMFFAFVFEVLATYPALTAYVPVDLAQAKYVIGLASMLSITLVAVYTVYSGVVFARENWAILKLNQLS